MRALACALLLAAAACGGGSSATPDGPIDYVITPGFSPQQGLVTLHVDDATGFATVHDDNDGSNKSIHLDDMALQTVIGAVADADLPDLRAAYTCADFQCGADANSIMIKASFGGALVTVGVDRNIDETDLPSDLVGAMHALDALVTEVEQAN
jgi:hypothetical protein